MQAQHPRGTIPRRAPQRRGGAARLVVLAGLATILTAALLVPLPLRLVHPGALVEVGPAVSVDVGEQFTSARPSTATSGPYLALREELRATAAQAVLALLDPRAAVAVEGGQPRAGELPQALVDAALSGLGISPVRGASLASDISIEVEASAPVDPRSLALALQVFDLAHDLDVSRGRTIVALGWIDAEGTVRCTGTVAAAATAAAAAGADVLLVPRACAAPDGDGPTEDVPTVLVGTFLEAIDAIAS